MSGERECELQVQAADRLSNILKCLRQLLDVQQVDVVLRNDQLMTEVISHCPLITLEGFCKNMEWLERHKPSAEVAHG